MLVLPKFAILSCKVYGVSPLSTIETEIVNVNLIANKFKWSNLHIYNLNYILSAPELKRESIATWLLIAKLLNVSCACIIAWNN